MESSKYSNTNGKNNSKLTSFFFIKQDECDTCDSFPTRHRPPFPYISIIDSHFRLVLRFKSVTFKIIILLLN